jgi:hypothetical protein
VGDPSALMGMGGGGGGMPPMGGPGMGTPGGQSPMAGDALSALDQLVPKQPNPTAALQKIEEALDLAYKLVSTIIAQVTRMNPKVAKDGHQVSRTLLNMKSELRKESGVGAVPDMMLGMGMAGSPGPLGPGPGGQSGGAL